jgi:transcription antitermination factor NusG
MPTAARAPRRWRLFYTAPRAERRCERRLLGDGVEAFVPCQTTVRQWSDRRKRVVEPLFPNYLFARVDERDRLATLQTPGVVRAVAFDGRPAEVSAEEIAWLRLLEATEDRVEPVPAPMPPRDTPVEIEDGPLRGLVGEVEAHRGGYRLLIRIPSIRQAVRVQVPAVWVRAC